MRLKLIRFRNFKSFKNVDIIFNSNINIILGPNGSGKSNICDGLKFILGERSLANLRVKSSKELIFLGSERASVEAIFEYEGQELQLERIIDQDKNIYKINSRKVSYEEYMSELSKLNLGNSYRFFIMQGQVEKIISLNKSDKLQLLYDGAGIQQFEVRKQEVIQEMNVVDSRISQLSLLIGEKMKFLDELRAESERAELFINVKNRIDILKNSIAYKEYNRLNKSISNTKAKLEELSKLKQELENKLNEVRAQIDNINKERDKILEDLRQSQMSKVMIELTEQQEVLQKKRTELMDKQRLLFERNKMYQGLLAKRQEIINRINWLNSKVKNVDIDDIQNYINELGDINNKLIQLESEITNLNVKHREFGEIIKNMDEINSIKAQLSEINNKILELYKKDNELSSQIKNIDEKIKELEKEREYNQVQSSILILENFVKDLKQNIPGVYDMIINLIDFDSKLKNAVDAFGTRLLNIVVENVDTAKKINEILRAGAFRVGRITIIPLEELNVTSYRNVNIGLGLIKNHIGTDKKFEKILDFVFGDVVLMSNFDEARKYIGKYRMVTLDGEFFDITGAITLGTSNLSISSARLYADIVKRIEELKARKEELLKTREQILNKITELREAKASLDSKLSLYSTNISESELKNIAKKIEELNKDKQKLLDRKSELEKIIENYKDKIKDIEEMAAYKREMEIKKQELKDTEMSIKEIDLEIIELNSKIREMSDSIRIEELSLAQKRRQYIELDQKLKQKMEESRFKEEELKKLGYEQQKLLDEYNHVEKNIYKYEKELSNNEIEVKNINYNPALPIIEEDMEKIRQELENLENQLTSMGNINFRAKEMFDALSKDISDIDIKINKLRKDKEELINMLHEIEAKKELFFRDFIARIGKRFKELTLSIKGLGEGNLEINNGDVEISLYRDNKMIRLESLSGGEKSLLGLLLIFSMNQENPLPITVFDEVDAALDKMNKERLKNFILDNAEKTQFIIVTHSEDVAKIGKNIIGVSKSKEGSKIAQIAL